MVIVENKQVHSSFNNLNKPFILTESSFTSSFHKVTRAKSIDRLWKNGALYEFYLCSTMLILLSKKKIMQFTKNIKSQQEKTRLAHQSPQQ